MTDAEMKLAKALEEIERLQAVERQLRHDLANKLAAACAWRQIALRCKAQAGVK